MGFICSQRLIDVKWHTYILVHLRFSQQVTMYSRCSQRLSGLLLCSNISSKSTQGYVIYCSEVRGGRGQRLRPGSPVGDPGIVIIIIIIIYIYIYIYIPGYYTTILRSI